MVKPRGRKKFAEYGTEKRVDGRAQPALQTDIYRKLNKALIF
jgi:hypothetical protein